MHYRLTCIIAGMGFAWIKARTLQTVGRWTKEQTQMLRLRCASFRMTGLLRVNFGKREIRAFPPIHGGAVSMDGHPIFVQIGMPR